MYDREIYEKTRELLQQLNKFIIHVALYFFVNIALVIIAFNDIGNRWWLFFLVISWALILIGHGLKVYGINLLGRKNRTNSMWSWI